MARGRLFPARPQFPATRQPAIRRGRRRPVRGLDHAAAGFIEPRPVIGMLRGRSGGDDAGQEAGVCALGPVVAWSHGEGWGLAGHGSACRSICLPGWSSAERRARLGSGGMDVASRSMAVR